MPQIMLENLYTTVKNKASTFGRGTVDTLKITVESMKYSKPFGVSKDTSVTGLEKEICQLIDSLQADLDSNPEDVEKRVADIVMTIKQKTVLRDSMIKK
jgi:flagellar biosynthesis/type III secretory pathway protein FliH